MDRDSTLRLAPTVGLGQIARSRTCAPVSRLYPCHFLEPDDCTVKIGDRTLLACNVSVITATHPVSPEERRGSLGKEYAKPVTIGDDCWIGANVVILPGVTIGNGVTVGAGSVVTKDVEDRSIVVGELSLLHSVCRAWSDISFRQSGTTSEEGIGTCRWSITWARETSCLRRHADPFSHLFAVLERHR